MADKRDNENQDEPKIKIVDSRMLSDDERAGKGAAQEAETERPKLEIIGGGAKNDSAPKAEAEPQAGSTPAAQDAHDLEEGDELSPAERDQMREQVENEQFAALEQQMGRPLTPQEKEQVREEMKKQAESISRLEVEPLLVQMMAEMSARAAVHLGLMPNPYTRLVARNDTQARLAIDAYGAVYEVIKNQLDDNTRREFERVLTDLRVNFSSITGTPATNFPGSGGFGGPRIIH
jgi:hypothetical protein